MFPPSVVGSPEPVTSDPSPKHSFDLSEALQHAKGAEKMSPTVCIYHTKTCRSQ